MLTSKMQ